MYLVAFLFPVAAVACDLAQLALDIDVVRTRLLGGGADDLVGQADLTCDFDGERAARLAGFEPEKRPDVLHVESHRAVEDALCVARVVFDVRIVGGDHSETSLRFQLFEYRFGDRSADDRLGAGAEFVDQDQRTVVGMAQDVLHVQQVRTVGAQVVVDRLLVSDVDENTAEDSHLGVLRDRNQQAALHHVLQKAHSFEAHRLAARIRPRDNENVLLRGEYQIERNDTFALFAQGLRQQGVSCVFQQDRAALLDDRHRAVVVECKTGFGPDQVHRREVIARRRDARQFGTQHLGEAHQYAHHFTALFVFQLFELVVDFDDLDRLDINRFAGSRFVVDETFDFSFICGADRNHGTSFTDRNRCIGIDQPGGLCLRHDLLQAARNLSFPLADRAADGVEFRRRTVLDLAEAVDDRVDVVDDFGESLYVAAQCPQARVFGSGIAAEEPHQFVGGGKALAQRKDFAGLQEGSRDFSFFEKKGGIDVIAFRKIAFEHQNRAHLESLFEQAYNLFARSAEVQSG